MACALALVGTGLLAALARADPDVVRSVQRYTLPPDALQRADGRHLTLAQALRDSRPVVLTFFYSACQTVCPISNQVMVDLERRLGAKRPRVPLVSISIDPDHDTVQRITAYAKETGNHGSLFTGDPAASEAVQRAFDRWRGDKMHHAPVFLLNADTRRSNQWIRLSGLVMPQQLLDELDSLVPALALALALALKAR